MSGYSRWLVSLALLAAAVPASRGTREGAAPLRELRLCIPTDPRSFDPLHISDESSEMVRDLTAGALARINRVTGNVEPGLAESWKISKDGCAIRFHLRANLKFSNGMPLTASDVARTLSTALEPSEASPAGDPFRSPQGNPSVQVLSSLDVAIRYSAPRPDIERLFDGLAIIPARSGQPEVVSRSKLPASAGPFYVTEYEPGEQRGGGLGQRAAGAEEALPSNPNYWKKDNEGNRLPRLDSIRLDVQPNREIELTRFLRGDIQIINKLDPEKFDRVARENPSAARNLGPSLDSEFLWFNEAPSSAVPEWKRKWFTSAAFRHAISEAIHRDDIVRIVFRGHAHPAAGPVSSANHFWFNPSLKPLPFDSAASLSALAREGFTFRNDALTDRDGHAVEFSIITNSGNRAREAMAALIQSDLRKIGIRVNIVTLDFGSLIERIAKTSQYEAALLGYANVDIEPAEQMNVWLSSGAQHAWWPMQKSPATPWEARIDRLELMQASEPSRDLRRKALGEVQRILVREEPIIFLVNPDYLAAISPRLRGVQPVVSPPQILWNIEWLRLE